MKRIDFLANLAGSVVLARLPISTLETVVTTHTERLISIYSGNIRGIRYYKGEKLLRSLAAGTLLTLKREPKNRYDDLAIEVFCSETKLGYVARECNVVLANMMDEGVEIVAQIADNSDVKKDDIFNFGFEVFLKK
jgi:HIRAN domain